MQCSRIPAWLWILGALIAAPFLLFALFIGLFVMGESKEFVERRAARFEHFETLDPAKEEKIMLETPIPDMFNSREELREAIWDLKVPGYGSVERRLSQPDGSTIWLDSVEIPDRDKDRCLVFRETGGKLAKLDDFIYDAEHDTIADVRIERTRVTYVNPHGAVVPVTRLRPP